jgi:lipocalin
MTVELLQVGNILDAQDYLGAWYIAIVIDDNGPA